jgi:hypothetical protein
MTYKTAMLVWNPGTSEVLVGPWPDRSGWSKPYKMSSGACYKIRAGKSKQYYKMMAFIDAMHLIVRDKVDPIAVHNAMLSIDEYRDGCSDDMPGIHRLF